MHDKLEITLKMHQMCSVHPTPEEFKIATITCTSHSGFVFEENSGRTALGPYVLTSSQIFSRPARPYPVLEILKILFEAK